MCRKVLLLAVVIGLCAGPAMAVVIDVALYKLGEDDLSAWAGRVGNDPTVDSTGGYVGGNHLDRFGDPTYSDNTEAMPRQTVVSTLSMDLDGDDYYRTSGLVYDLGEDNWGIEGWVYSTDADHNGFAFANGRYIFGQWGGNFLWHRNAQGNVGEAALQTNVWTHMALVRENGVLTAYMNGQPLPSTDRTDGWDFDFCIGGVGWGAGERWIGLVDHVRLFEFEPGQFSVSDLNYVPEPATLALLGLGGLALLRVRRKRR